MPDKFTCTVVTPEQSLLEEDVKHVSIPAWDGRMGVLPQRAPLLAKLGYGPLELELAGGGKQRYFVGGGFVQMKGERLTLLTDEAKPVDQIDAEEAEAALKEAQALRGITADEVAKRDRDTERARAMVAVAKERSH